MAYRAYFITVDGSQERGRRFVLQEEGRVHASRRKKCLISLARKEREGVERHSHNSPPLFRGGKRETTGEERRGKKKKEEIDEAPGIGRGGKGGGRRMDLLLARRGGKLGDGGNRHGAGDLRERMGEKREFWKSSFRISVEAREDNGKEKRRRGF